MPGTGRGEEDVGKRSSVGDARLERLADVERAVPGVVGRGHLGGKLVKEHGEACKSSSPSQASCSHFLEFPRKRNVARGTYPGGAVVKNLPASTVDTGSSPGPGKSHMPWSS